MPAKKKVKLNDSPEINLIWRLVKGTEIKTWKKT